MTKRKKRRIIFITALALLVLALAPFPVRVNDNLKARAVSHTLDALVHNKRVLTTRGYIRFYDCNAVKDEGRLYFENGLGISDTVFLERGLKPIPKDRRLRVDDGDVIVSFSYQDDEGERTRHIQFHYVFGWLGAQGYEIRVYRSLLFPYFIYLHQWVS